jgi:hypothetical protein
MTLLHPKQMNTKTPCDKPLPFSYALLQIPAYFRFFVLVLRGMVRIIGNHGKLAPVIYGESSRIETGSN